MTTIFLGGRDYIAVPLPSAPPARTTGRPRVAGGARRVRHHPGDGLSVTCSDHYGVLLPLPRDGCVRLALVDRGMRDGHAGGFAFSAGCATAAGKWAAELRAEDTDMELVVEEVCSGHREQPAAACEDCTTAYDAT